MEKVHGGLPLRFFSCEHISDEKETIGSRSGKASSRCRRFLLAITKILIYKKAPDTKLHETNLPGDFKWCSSGYHYKHPQI
jgi:hypothetical protein